jgi:hypothetical protein
MYVDLAVLPTVGMWRALRARRHQWAVLGTLGRIMLVPWAGIFLWIFLGETGALSPGESEMALMFAFWFVAGIVTDLIFCAQARVGLGRGLRYWMTGGTRSGKRERLQAARASVAGALYA